MEKPGLTKRDIEIIFPNLLHQMMLKEKLTTRFGIYQDIFRRYHLVESTSEDPFPRNEFLEGFDGYTKERENPHLLEFFTLIRKDSESFSKIEKRYFCLNCGLWIVSPSGRHEINFSRSFIEGETTYSEFEVPLSKSKKFLFNHEQGVSCYVKKEVLIQN